MNSLPGLELEFDRAAQARAKGNEGQARVCARRAAGIAIREYFARRGIRVRPVGAYDLLNMLGEEGNLPVEIRSVIRHLTMRVNEEFQLPVDADLIAESKTLCAWLLKAMP